MKKISVVTVCFNAENTINDTIWSVVSQDYGNIEYIVIDGGSKDCTMDILGNYKNHISVLISEKDRGIYDAMNKGIQLATGEYVIFMNSGDTFASEDVISKFVSNIKEEGVYYGNTFFVRGLDKTLRVEKASKYSFTRKNVCHQSMFYPSSLLKEVCFELKYPILSDWITNIILFKKTNYYHLNFPVSIFSCDGVSSSDDRMKDMAFIDDFPKVCLRNLGLFPYIIVKIKFTIHSICRI